MHRKRVYLLPGWGFSARIWGRVYQQLSEFCNPSCVELWKYFTVTEGNKASQQDALLENIHQATEANATWVVWSMSGLLATQLADRYPGHIAGLVQVASTPKFVSDNAWQYAIEKTAFEQFKTNFRLKPADTLRQFCRLVIAGDGGLRLHRKEIGDCLINAETYKNELCLGLDIMADQDCRAMLSRLSVPGLFVMGEKDHLLDSRYQGSLNAGSNAHTHMITGASHVPFIGHEDEFCEQIKYFLMQKIK